MKTIRLPFCLFLSRFSFTPFIILCILLVSGSCKKKPGGTEAERAFYYWKSNEYSLTDAELNQVKKLQPTKLYVKFFEVKSDSFYGNIPDSKSQLHMHRFQGFSYEQYQDSMLRAAFNNMSVIPVVFVRNEVLRNSSHGLLDTLADNMIFLIDKFYREKYVNMNKPYQEIQIDCDWTIRTRDQYFYLLTQIKKRSNKTISCTLRLYPYKYTDKMGVPPVDKVTLMCYNLIAPLDHEDKNSILHTGELTAYLKKTKPYPLHTDIALPVFSWMQVYQHGQFTGTVKAPYDNIMPVLKQIKPLWYEVTEDIECGDMYLRQGDRIKMEDVPGETTHKAIELLKKHVQLEEKITVTLFHLDEHELKRYSHETLSSFFTAFRQ